MTEWQPLEAGTLLHERYEVEALLGKGGFGATYRARDRERFDQPCALKELLPARATNPKVLELFEREARILLALRHPGIPALHAYFDQGGRYYLVEDYVGGATLAQVVEERGPLPEAEVTQVMREALTILQYLHGRSPAVIHRDIKPTNMIRGDNGRLYLIDFGAVKEALGQPNLDPESTVIKSAGYTPPEQTRGVVVPASDLYALGATALHLASGRHPFELYDALSGQWQFAGRLNLSRRLEGVLGRMLEEQIPRRIASAAEALTALSAPVTGAEAASPATTQIEGELPPVPRDAPLAVGAVLRGRYEARAVLHQDPSSTTYRAVDRQSFGRPCLLIELRPTADTETRVRQAFEHEARRLAALTHPALPRVLAFFPEGGRYYVIQEVVEGETLAERVRTRGPLGEAEVVGILRAALDGLTVIHECSPPIVHGALQPSRLVVTGPGVVMFTDFRSFRDTLAGRDADAPAPAAESPYAPAGDQGEAQPVGDLFSLGATAQFLLTGRLPTELRGVTRLPGVGPGLQTVLSKMMAPAATARYQSAREVLADLDTLPAETQPLPAPMPPSPAPVPVRAGSWFTLRNLVIAGVVAAVGIGLLSRGRDEPRPPEPVRPPAPAVQPEPTRPPAPVVQPEPTRPPAPAVQPPAPAVQPAPTPEPTQPERPSTAIVPPPRPTPIPPPPRATGRAGFLGVVGVSDGLNINGRRQQALLVRSLISNGPAQRAGVREGDAILSIDGQPVLGPRELFQALSAQAAGGQVRIELYSGGRVRSTTATLMNSPFPEFTEGRAADPAEGPSRFFPQPDPGLVDQARRLLVHWDAIVIPGYGYLWVRYPEGWRLQRWGRNPQHPTLLYAQGPDGLSRFDLGLLWEDAPDLAHDAVFNTTFWGNLRNDARGAELLGDRMISRSVKRYWFSQQLDSGPALSEFTLQISTNPTVTFAGSRRTFYRWRWMRVPAGDRSSQSVSLLEAMRLESGLIPAL